MSLLEDLSVDDVEMTGPMGPQEPLVLPPIHPEEWKLHSLGACRKSMSSGHLDTSNRQKRSATREAKAMCQSCVVIDVCRDVCDYIERNQTSHSRLAGVWGGEVPMERTRRRLAAKHAD